MIELNTLYDENEDCRERMTLFTVDISPNQLVDQTTAALVYFAKDVKLIIHEQNVLIVGLIQHKYVEIMDKQLERNPNDLSTILPNTVKGLINR